MKLLVIDGNSIVNRAFFGMHELTNDEGFPTHAIYGFLNIMRRLEEEVDPDGVCVTFDRKEPTFRHLAFAAYKAQRQKMPEGLAVQLVTDRTYVELVTTRMGKTTTKEMDPAAFREVYGMEPERMVDLKALMGDSSDNVPGVPGVGEKTALALLHANDSLQTVYARLADGTLDAKPGVKKKLTDGR